MYLFNKINAWKQEKKKGEEEEKEKNAHYFLEFI